MFHKIIFKNQYFFKGREFWWQIKLPVAVIGVKIWELHKSKDQYVLYARRKYLFCHSEV